MLTAVWVGVLFTCFDQPLALLQRHWVLILVGVAGAVIGNATAIGGGLVFIPFLTLAYQVEPVQSLKLALATQSVGMTSGAIAWVRRGVVPLGLLRIALPAMLVGAAISSLLIRPSPLLVKGLFGPVSILVGALALIQPSRAEGADSLPESAHWPLRGIAFLGGLVTGWVAIGEGEVVAALLMLRYGLSTPSSIGLGVVLLAINSIFLASVHTLFLGGIPWDMAIFTMLGVLWGGRLGAYITQFFRPRVLKVTFGSIAIGDGLLFLVQFARSLAV